MKRNLALLLALVMAMGMLPLMASAEDVTIKIPVYDRGFEGWNVTDNYYTRWIQEEFGDPNGITVQFIAITRSAEAQDYMQMLAAGTAPDIIFHYDMPQAVVYHSEGAMQPLDAAEMEQYAPTYYAMTREMMQTYGELDGETYFFFAERPTAYNWLTLIRQDWLDAVGMDMPRSLEEYNEVLLAWKEAGLGYVNHQLVKDNFTYSYPFRTWPNDEKEHVIYSELGVADMTWEPTYKYLKNLNWQYNNGVLNPEFYLKEDFNETMADFIAGTAGTYSLYLTAGTPAISSLLANDPQAKVSTLDPLALVPGGEYNMERGYWPFGMIMGINSATDDATRIAVWKYLEWMMQPENLFKLENGVEGENYTLDENGLAIAVEGYDGESVLSDNNNKDYWCLWEESATYPTQEAQEMANRINWAPAGYEHLIEDSKAYFERDAATRVPDALFTTAVESVNEYKGDLNTLWQELYVQCVMASEEDFDAVYEESCQIFLDAGYQAILDEKTALYEAGSYR